MKIKLVWISLIGQLAMFSLEGASPSLQFQGNHNFTDSSLAEQLSQKDLDIEIVSSWTSAQKERAKRLVQVYYQDRGYPLSSVQFEKNFGQYFLKVLEGPKARFSRVRFEGNASFSDKHLVNFFGLGSWFNQGEIAGSLEQIRRFYADKGYIRATVREGQLEVSERKLISYFPVPFRTKNTNCATLQCTISEGDKYYFGKITFPEGFELRDLSVPARGEVFRRNLLASMRVGIVRRVQLDGKLLKNLRVLQDIKDDSQCVDVRVDVEAYPTLLINRIEFTGNKRFPDSFYRRELEIDEKSIFYPLDLEHSLRRLAKTGTLASLSAEDVELTVDEKTLEVDVLFHLKERDRHGVLYSFGPGQYGGLEASLVYSILNLIGLGEVLGLEVSAGDTTTGVAVQMASRYLLGTDLPISIALGLFRQHSGVHLPGLDTQISELLGIKETGISGQFNYRIHSSGNVGAGASLARTSSGNTHLLLTPYLSRGKRLGIFQRISLLQGLEGSWNLRPSFKWTQQAGEKFEFRMVGSHAFFFGTQAPLSERLFTGPNTVRGFSVSGPLGIKEETPAYIGGDTLIAFNSEYTVPVAKPVSLLPFLDIGLSTNLAGLKEDNILANTNRLPRCSTGSEVRVKVPKLPQLRLIFSWNPFRLDPEPAVAQIREPAFSFRVGLARW